MGLCMYSEQHIVETRYGPLTPPSELLLWDINQEEYFLVPTIYSASGNQGGWGCEIWRRGDTGCNLRDCQIMGALRSSNFSLQHDCGSQERAAKSYRARRNPHIMGRWPFISDRVYPPGTQDEVRNKARNQDPHAGILVQPLTCCVTLDKAHNLSSLHFPVSKMRIIKGPGCCKD